MNRLWSTISNLPVVARDSENTLGKLNGMFMNPETGQVIGFLVSLVKVLTPNQIEKWGHLAIQVSDEEDVVPLNEILRLEQYGLRRCFLNGKRVLSKSGRRLGRVRDFRIDPQTASVLDLHTSKRFLGLEWEKRIFPIKDVSEVTEKAIVLSVEPEQTVKEEKRSLFPAAGA